MAKRMLIMILALVVVFGGVFGWKRFIGAQIKKAMSAERPPVTVSAITASNDVWHPTLQAVGTLRAVQGIELSPEVSGIVKGIHFKSGQQVHQGDLLVQLDIATEQAQLKSYQAQEKLARLQLQRTRELSATKVATPSDLDQAEANYRQAQANVEREQATIDKKTIRAPFSGLVGIRQIDLGEYLSAGAEIVTLQSLNPIYVDFSLPQQDLDRIKVGQPVAVSLDAYTNTQFTGKIIALNSRVTAATRSFDIRASLPNPDLKLRPGMFGEVSVQLPAREKVVTLPKTAVTYNPYGDSVFLIHPTGNGPHGKPALAVQRVFVQTGERRGTQVAILKGVQAGDQVVTSGQMKLQEGSRVRINNEISPVNVPSANPPDE